MTIHAGRCVCGALSWETRADPLRVTTCHCRFCQRATGAAYFVEPIFKAEDFVVTAGEPKSYRHRSEGSGKYVTIHFCGTCSSKSHLSFERFPDVVGVYAGGFDEPNWFEISAGNSKHIFLEVARKETVIPPGIPTYQQHAINNDGHHCVVTIHENFHQVRKGMG